MHHLLNKPWLLLFYIWGLQWIASGILGLFNETNLIKTLTLVTILLAIIASLLTIGFKRTQILTFPAISKQSWKTYLMAFPFIIFIGSIILVWFLSESDHLLKLHVFRAILLAFFYVMSGALLNKKELIWLGYWLFGFAAIVSIWYLGYSPIVFDGMGVISLLACGWIINRT